jgi:hypothetical protein
VRLNADPYEGREDRYGTCAPKQSSGTSSEQSWHQHVKSNGCMRPVVSFADGASAAIPAEDSSCRGVQPVSHYLLRSGGMLRPSRR